MKFLCLSSLLREVGEEKTTEILSSFHVSKNPDVDHFIHDLAVSYEKSNNARTFIYLSDFHVPLGFVSLSLASLTIPDSISEKLKKRIRGFGRLSSSIVPSYLIGQLGRFDSTSKAELSSQDIFSRITDTIKMARKLFGGRVVSVDCIDPLLPYYENRGFVKINKIKDLNQMIYIIKDENMTDLQNAQIQ